MGQNEVFDDYLPLHRLYDLSDWDHKLNRMTSDILFPQLYVGNLPVQGHKTEI